MWLIIQMSVCYNSENDSASSASPVSLLQNDIAFCYPRQTSPDLAWTRLANPSQAKQAWRCLASLATGLAKHRQSEYHRHANETPEAFDCRNPHHSRPTNIWDGSGCNGSTRSYADCGGHALSNTVDSTANGILSHESCSFTDGLLGGGEWHMTARPIANSKGLDNHKFRSEGKQLFLWEFISWMLRNRHWKSTDLFGHSESRAQEVPRRLSRTTS